MFQRGSYLNQPSVRNGVFSVKYLFIQGDSKCNTNIFPYAIVISDIPCIGCASRNRQYNFFLKGECRAQIDWVIMSGKGKMMSLLHLGRNDQQRHRRQFEVAIEDNS